MPNDDDGMCYTCKCGRRVETINITEKGMLCDFCVEEIESTENTKVASKSISYKNRDLEAQRLSRRNRDILVSTLKEEVGKTPEEIKFRATRYDIALVIIQERREQM